MQKSKSLSKTGTYRASAEEYALIEEGAKRNNMSVSRYMVECAVQGLDLSVARTRTAVIKVIDLQNYVKQYHPLVWEDERFQKGVTAVWQCLNV